MGTRPDVAKRYGSWALALALLCALAGGCLNPPVQQPLTPFGAPPTPVPGPVIDTGTPVGAAPLGSAPVVAAAPAPTVTAPPVAAVPAPAAVAVAPAVVPLATAPLPTAPIAPVPGSAPIATPIVGTTDSGVLLSPSAIVAPVGASVIMVAGVYGPGRQMQPFQRVEWTLSPGAVGQISGVGDFNRGLFGGGLFSAPSQKVSPMSAVNETLPRSQVVTRGTSLPGDALTIVRGQTWISVTSPLEGATYVTAMAPALPNWQTRQQTAVVHWVDAGWIAPPPLVAPAGSRHTLTTTVTRRSNGDALGGWRVRYEITGGPDGGFGPEGVRAIEVPTNDLGQASVEIGQPRPEQGNNPILIQIIRPAGIVPGGQRLIVGTAATDVSWSAPKAALQITGPQQASVGATVAYQIRVNNPGDTPITGVTVSDPLPPGLTFLRSTPPAETSVQPGGAGQANVLQWTLGAIAPGETKTIDLDTRAEAPGAINNAASMRTAEGLAGQDAVTTTIRGGAVEVRLTGPSTATVGSSVRFDLEIINRGETAASGLRVRDTFDEGLDSAATDKHVIERDLYPIDAGQSFKVPINFRVTKAGRLCQTVEVTGPNGLHETTQTCVDASGDGAGPGAPAIGGALPSNPASPPPTNPTPGVPSAEPPSVSAKISVQPTAQVGDTILFAIEVQNTGKSRIANLQVNETIDGAALQVKAMTDGGAVQGNRLSWTIKDFDPGGKARREAQCVCQAPSQRACAQMTVTDGATINQQGEACLAITGSVAPPPAGSGLNASIATRANPIRLGAETSLVLTVVNNGANSERRVALNVAVAEGLQITTVPETNPARSTVDGQTVQFDPIAQIQPGERLTFEVKVRSLKVGDSTVRASVTSQSQPQPVTSQAAISVLGG